MTRPVIDQEELQGGPELPQQAPGKMADSVVFSVPWFDIVSRTVDGATSPYYLLRTSDYVTVLAKTTDGSVLLVQQFRPVVGAETLELPSGHVEEGESPEVAARRELAEETGYEAQEFELLGTLAPDTGRLGNKLWCFYAQNATLIRTPTDLEEGVRLVLYEFDNLLRDVATGKIDHALHLGVLLLAAVKGRLVVGQRGINLGR
ncbi:MAG: NUDIX hydrolase [Acidobacteriia bacterium]|nr:NUDIX hydrolase [Terriglobia bacterium]